MSLPTLTKLRLPPGAIGYRTAGTGAPLVLLHGLGGNSKSWEQQFRHFGARRRAIAWDAPGYGGSDDLPEEAPLVDDYVDRLEGMLFGLGLDRPDLLGHSMGGVVAARFAARRPERVRRLVLSCTRADFVSRDPDAFVARIDELRRLPRAVFGRRRAEGMAAPGAPDQVVDRLAAIAAEARVAGFAAAARMLRTADNRPLLGRIRAPTLVVSGSLDRIALGREADDLAARIRGARHVRIGGAGHAPYLERTQDYDAAVGRFLSARFGP